MKDIVSAGMAPTLGMAFALVEDAFRRLAGYADGMTEAEFQFIDPGNVNSTAMLIRHLINVDLEYLHQIMGRPVPPELEAKYGPYADENGQIPQVAGVTGAQLLEAYRGVIEMARVYLSGLTDADATTPVVVPWWKEPATVRYVLWHMASHSSGHLGQIARIRALYRQQAGDR